MIKKICAYCGGTIQEGSSNVPASHGICRPCVRVHFPSAATTTQTGDTE